MYLLEVLLKGSLVVGGLFLGMGAIVGWFVCALIAVQGWSETRRQRAFVHLVTWGPFVLFFGVLVSGVPR